MEGREFRPTIPTGGTRVPPVSTPANSDSSDALTRYLEQSMDFEGLAGDIKTLVAERLQQSMPDDRKIILDLVSQMGALTSEVRLLRKQIESNTAEAYPVVDISSELAEIKQLIESSPVRQELEAPKHETIILPSSVPTKTESVLQEKTAPQAETASPPDPMPAAAPMTATAILEAEAAAGEPESSVPSNQEPAPATENHSGKHKKKKERKKTTALSVISNIIFYAMIIGIVLGAFLVKSGSGGQPSMIAGYSAFTVLTSSMEDTYPKGSLIITQRVDADELQVGDDITYMISESSSITHRIIGITENYLNTGDRAFETQGTMNEKPDKEPVAAANVVGKVIFCSEGLGQAATFVSNNWQLLLVYVVVLGGLFAFLKWNFSRDDSEEDGRRAQKRKR